MKLSRHHSLNDLVDKILTITKDLSACEHAQAGDDYLENPKKQARVQKYEYRFAPIRDKTPIVSVGYPWQPISSGVDRRGNKNCGRAN